FVLAEPRFATNSVETGREADGLFAPLTLGSRVYVTLPNGQRAGFTFTPVATQVGGTTLYLPRWTADAGVAFTLSSGEVQLKEVGGEFFQVSNGLPYNPQSGRHGSFDYQLRGPDGTRYM